MRTQSRNKLIGLGLGTLVACMIGLSFAAVPLYKLFCGATGYAGTPKVGLAAAPGGVAQTITVRFNADTNPALPWEFRPVQRDIRLPLGDERVAFYTARNLAPTPVTG